MLLIIIILLILLIGAGSSEPQKKVVPQRSASLRNTSAMTDEQGFVWLCDQKGEEDLDEEMTT